MGDDPRNLLCSLPLNELLARLGTDPEKGLSKEEAKRRLELYGPNELPEKRTHPLIRFLSYFWGPIPWMIELALAISFFIGDWIDFWIIAALLFINAVVEFWQEWKAENVLEYLKKKMAVFAKVKRDGRWKKVPARELVPGDIIFLRLGDIVPADVRVLDGEVLMDESVLTGESLPVEKKKGDVLYSGSIVKRGEAVAVVVLTGERTFFGETVKLVREGEAQTELQKMIIKIGDYLILLALGVILIMLIVEVLFRHKPLLEAVKFSLVLAVASIPAALPAVLSVTMAVGAMELARRNAIVTRLVSIEELAGVDVLTSDKTGTLTKNELEVAEVVPMGGYTLEEVLRYALMASEEGSQDPIDVAIIRKSREMEIRPLFRVLEFRPFSPETKRTEAVVEVAGDVLRVVKGAPQVVASLSCGDTNVNEAVERLASKGFRAIAVAVGHKEGCLKVVGVIGLFDPPRGDAKRAVSLIKELGVRVKMVTGDHREIARYIAKLLGIGERVMVAEDFRRLKGEKRLEAIERADVFAEVLPEHKYEIVVGLQKRGHLVAMTGDGVNDVPALKKANCGIAVAGATDAARAVASIVLLQPGISVIAEALRISRRIFKRMESYVLYRLTETIRVLFFLASSILIFNFYPVNATMVILLALLNDIPILMIAYDNVKEPRRPVRWQVKKILSLSTALGVSGLVSSFLLLFLGVRYLHLSKDLLRTLIFLKLVVAGHSTLFITRSEGYFWERPYPSKKLLAAILLTDLIGTLIAVYGIFVEPIGWGLALFVWAYALVWLFINDVVKQVVGKRVGIDAK